jgi:hypothetical protein
MTAATNAFYRQVVRYGGIPFELRVEKFGPSVAAPSDPVKNPAKKRITLEQVFGDWNGGFPEPYDWGGTDAPTGRELL